ncbi:MAG: alpha/beta hydrolase [Candidatus Staskawiczbacteria bacterium]|jgi:predicted alpha/beta hydrolase family esterase
MSNNIFIFHGTRGSPEENWFPWLKAELEKSGCKVFTPRFPTPENQNLESWFEAFENYKKYINKNSIFIGHSIGCAFILDVLEQIDIKINTCFFVAGFLGLLNLEVDKLNKTISDKEFDWEKIKNNCNKFILFQSDDDPYVSMGKAEELKEKLDGELIIIKGAGHFNAKAGYLKFEKLRDKVLEILQK